MKVIVAGSRDIEEYEIVKDAISQSGFYITMLVSGMARGVDRLAVQFALKYGIKIEEHYPEWNKYGKKAGCLRNIKMLDSGAEALIAVWDGKSKGTAHIIREAKKRNVPIFVYHWSLEKGEKHEKDS